MCKISGNYVQSAGKVHGYSCANSSTGSQNQHMLSRVIRGKTQVLPSSPNHLFAQLSTTSHRLTYLLSQGFSPQSPVPITITTKF